jgi:hypothetical protein
MLTKVQMSPLVNTMLIHQQEELNVFEKNTCSYSHPTWKPTSHANGSKGVANCIMGFCVFVAMSTT